MRSYAELVHESSHGTIFHTPWWLDAVAPDAWSAHEVINNGIVIAAWPTVTRVTPFGPVHHGPELTPYLGPLFEQSPPGRRLAAELPLLKQLLDAIGPFAHLEARCAPEFDYWAPLAWHGFAQTTQYTWRLNDLTDIDATFHSTRSSVRRAVKKARAQLEVIDGTLNEFLPLMAATFLQQRTSPPDVGIIRRIDAAAGERGARSILIARDASGTAHAGAFFVHDGRRTYYLLGGSDASLRSSGAMPLVLWTAIEQAAAAGRSFDFEGSSIESIERFFRTFSGSPVACSRVHSTPSRWFARARAVRSSLQR